MICKEGDMISIGSKPTPQAVNHHQSTHNGSGHNTLQHRRKSQLITFSSSSCDIKNSLSHEILLVNGGGGARGSIASSNGGAMAGNGNTRLSFAEEDIMIVSQHGNGNLGDGCGGDGSLSGTGSGSATGSGGSGHEGDLEDDVFRRRSLADDDVELEEVEDMFDDEYGTRIERHSHNANDDSGGGSYEDSHALHSSMGGSNRNSLEKDDDDIDVDVISTDVSCYDQMASIGGGGIGGGVTCHTRNDDDDRATLVGDGDNYSTCKLSGGGSVGMGSASGSLGIGGCGLSENGSSGGIRGAGGGGSNGGGGGGGGGAIIYANPFMDDEGIAESGM